MSPNTVKILLDKFVAIASLSAALTTLASYQPAPPLLLALAIAGFLGLYAFVGENDRGLSAFSFFIGVALALIALMAGGA